MRSPQTIGEEWPRPGIAVFQRTCSSWFQLVSRPVSCEIRRPSAPPSAGQFESLSSLAATSIGRPSSSVTAISARPERTLRMVFDSSWEAGSACRPAVDREATGKPALIQTAAWTTPRTRPREEASWNVLINAVRLPRVIRKPSEKTGKFLKCLAACCSSLANSESDPTLLDPPLSRSESAKCSRSGGGRGRWLNRQIGQWTRSRFASPV